MDILVAFEESGTIREALRSHGHNAISCDLKPSRKPGPHYQGDARQLMKERWDMIIAHPPCTFLSLARNPKATAEQLWAAVDLLRECLDGNAPLIAVENVRTYKVVRQLIGNPTCRVHPYHFGDNFTKETWWWTKNLPPLLPTMHSRTAIPWANSGDDPSRPHLRHVTRRTARARATTFPGMAHAIAHQWAGVTDKILSVTEDPSMKPLCNLCARPKPNGLGRARRRYCSDACKQKAYRTRKEQQDDYWPYVTPIPHVR